MEGDNANGVNKNEVYEDTTALYPDRFEPEDSITKIKKIIFFTAVAIMVMITVVISFSRGIAKDTSYVLLGFSIICIALVEIALCWLLRVGQLDAEKTWFLYFVGICIIIESIFTDVLLFD